MVSRRKQLADRSEALEIEKSRLIEELRSSEERLEISSRASREAEGFAHRARHVLDEKLKSLETVDEEARMATEGDYDKVSEGLKSTRVEVPEGETLDSMRHEWGRTNLGRTV